jgi:hypothetical protein
MRSWLSRLDRDDLRDRLVVYGTLLAFVVGALLLTAARSIPVAMSGIAGVAVVLLVGWLFLR